MRMKPNPNWDWKSKLKWYFITYFKADPDKIRLKENKRKAKADRKAERKAKWKAKDKRIFILNEEPEVYKQRLKMLGTIILILLALAVVIPQLYNFIIWLRLKMFLDTLNYLF